MHSLGFILNGFNDRDNIKYLKRIIHIIVFWLYAYADLLYCLPKKYLGPF